MPNLLTNQNADVILVIHCDLLDALSVTKGSAPITEMSCSSILAKISTCWSGMQLANFCSKMQILLHSEIRV